MDEIWKDIPGFEGYYQASSLGNIKRLSGKVWHTSKSGKRHLIKKNEKYLKFDKKINGAGYFGVNLSIDNQIYNSDVHKLIALTFIGLSNGLDVNHIDGNKLNNRIENLEYMTRLENVHHAIQLGLTKLRHKPIGELNPRAKLSNKKVIEIKSLLINNILNNKEIAYFYKVSIHSINSIKYKKSWVSI